MTASQQNAMQKVRKRDPVLEAMVEQMDEVEDTEPLIQRIASHIVEYGFNSKYNCFVKHEQISEVRKSAIRYSIKGTTFYYQLLTA